MQILFNEILHHINHDRDCLLASIVADEGSAPRGSGARMLVNAAGRVCGTIGGGAVEFRCEQMGRELLAARQSLLHRFRFNKADTDALNMVCGGNVSVLFRYINAADPHWTRLCQQALAGSPAGCRLWLLERLDDLSQLPQLLALPKAAASADAPLPAALPPGLSSRLQGALPLNIDLGAAGSYYAEPLPQGQRVIIFGGGHIARELCPLLAHLDFRVTVFEDRPEYADAATLPGAENIVIGAYDDVAARLELRDDDFIVIMTHGHAHDYEVQRQIMSRAHAYLGVIGSRAKIATLNRRLLEEGFTAAQLEAVHTPIGTPILAQTPAEIAVSIAGELIEMRAKARGSAGGSCPV